MNILIALLLSVAAFAFGQTPSNLPTDMVSTGLSWNRYASAPVSEITTVAIRIGQTNTYSWSTLDTPIAKTPVGEKPQPSSIRTGAAYVFAQSGGARVAAFVLGDVGPATTPSEVVLQASGGLGLGIRIWRDVYAMPLYRVITTSGSGVYTVPEIQIGYSFGSTK